MLHAVLMSVMGFWKSVAISPRLIVAAEPKATERAFQTRK